MTPAKGYAKMKDSGIEWVGMIPATWDVFPAGGVFDEVKEKNVNNQYSNPFSFRYGEIVDKKIAGEIDESVEETLSAYRVVSPNTIMINGLNLNYDFISQRVAIVREKGIITSAYLAVQPDEGRIVPRFVLYLLKAYDYRQVFHGVGSGIRKTLKFQDFKSIKIVAPSLTEQTAIASYLDAQCAKIDEIIAQAKASIEDYKQWKASIIYEAVTKGLNPNVEMKDSGIEWIGRMPAHWTAPALKHLCTMQAGKNLISEQISTSGEYPVYGGNGQRGYYSDYNANGNFLLVGRQGALCGNVHYVSGKFWATEHAVVTTPSKITNIRYLYYLLIAMDLNQYASNSAAQPGLSVGNILTVKTLLPPIGEQVRISEFLDNGCPKIDEVITEKQSLIDDLESYKKSLIYEVVTGKRYIR